MATMMLVVPIFTFFFACFESTHCSMPFFSSSSLILMRSKTTEPFVFILQLLLISHLWSFVLLSEFLSSFRCWPPCCDRLATDSALCHDPLTTTFLKVRNSNTHNSGGSLESRLSDPKA
ncbi:hypothetical protein F5H01DRAFT_328610 [Linnemannia elongata]|nr:hypothetical protein F5H01DRAFT_328610 [Linnemannia elongata]